MNSIAMVPGSYAAERSPGYTPEAYSPESAAEVLTQLSAGRSLLKICEECWAPSRITFMAWVVNNVDGLADRYARARAACYEVWAEEVATISDDATNDFMIHDLGGVITISPLNAEAVARSKLRVDSRKWLLSKLLPNIYGDKLGLEHSGPGGKPIEIDDQTAINKLAAIFNSVLAQRDNIDGEAQRVDDGSDLI